MFGNALGYAFSPFQTASSFFRCNITLDSFLKSVTIAVSAYLYTDSLMTHYTTEDDFFYANARASGRVLKYTVPFIFLPTLRMLHSKLNQLNYLGVFAKQADRFGYHKFAAMNMLVFSSVHTSMHLAHNLSHLNIFKLEWISGGIMLAVAFLPITAMYLASSKLSRVAGYYMRFLLPHQLGWWGLIMALACHTQDYRLMPISAGVFLAFSVDRLLEWTKSFNSKLLKVIKIHDDMALVYFKKPDSFQFKPGDYVLLAYPWFSYFFNAAHPFTLASSEHDKSITFLITAKGAWTRQLISGLQPETTFRLTSPLSSPLNIDLKKMSDLMLMSSGSGMAMTLSFLNYIKNTGRKTLSTLAIYHSTRELAEIRFLLNLIDKHELPAGHVQMNLTGNSTLLPLNDARIQSGRLLPDSDQYFNRFKGHLFFCGAPAIGHGLKNICTDRPDIKLHLDYFTK